MPTAAAVHDKLSGIYHVDNVASSTRRNKISGLMYVGRCRRLARWPYIHSQ